MGRLVGYDATKCAFNGIVDEYGVGCKFIFLRAVSAWHSTLTIVLMYAIARNWGASVRGGLIAATLLALDGLNITEGRLVLIDSQLIFWIAASLYVAQLWWDRLNAETDAFNEAEAAGKPPPTHATDPRVRDERSFEPIAWCVAVGIACGNAFSVKMTGLATPGIIAVESTFAIFFLKRSAYLTDLLTVGVAGFFTYAFWFACHFALMTHAGDGDEFMSQRFQSTLKGNRHYNPAATWEGFWTNFFFINKRMVIHNAAILEPHPWQSSWWEWVANLRGVLYYSKDYKHTYTAGMYLIGNPAVLWGVVASLFLSVVLIVLFLRYRHTPGLRLDAFSPTFAQIGFCLTVYWLNLLPYLGVKRSTFIYVRATSNKGGWGAREAA